jgi:hypothetical protein
MPFIERESERITANPEEFLILDWRFHRLLEEKVPLPTAEKIALRLAGEDKVEVDEAVRIWLSLLRKGYPKKEAASLLEQIVL